MPRQYIRKTARGSWSSECLLNAMKAVRNRGMSVKQASERYQIPRSTLRDRLNDIGKVVEDNAPPKLGPGPVISGDFEEELAERAVFLSKMFYGITSDKLASVAFEFAERQQIKHRFNREQRKAGRDWVKGFLKRHPEVVVRKPENLSMARVEAMNRNNFEKFYDNLSELIGKTHYPPHRIYNVDETGISPVVPGRKILAEKGSKRVGRVSSSEKGKTTTVVGCVNAAGDAVPPMVIFGGRKRMKPELLKGTPIGTTGAVSDSGWVTTELFYKWFEHFVDHARPSVEKRVLLIMDNHTSHISVKLLCEARKCGVDIITLPPHSSHVLQPLDISVFGPFKKSWARQVQYFHDSHPGQRVQDGDIGELFGKAYGSAVKNNAASIVHGFRAAGISPFNPDEVLDNDELFMHNRVLTSESRSDSSELPAEEAGQTNQEPAHPAEGPEQVNQETAHPAEGSEQVNQETAHPVEGPEQVNQETAHPVEGPEQVNQEMAHPAKGPEQVDQESTRPAEEADQSSRMRAPRIVHRHESRHGKSPVDCLLPVPRIRRKRPVNAPRKKGSSMILTSSPVKRMIEDKEEKKKQPSHATGKKRRIIHQKKMLEGKTDCQADICMYCQEGVSGRNELWLQCGLCGHWAHEVCSNGSGARGFRCDLFCA